MFKRNARTSNLLAQVQAAFTQLSPRNEALQVLAHRGADEFERRIQTLALSPRHHGITALRHYGTARHRLQTRLGGIWGVSYLRKMLDVVLFPEIWKLRTAL